MAPSSGKTARNLVLVLVGLLVIGGSTGGYFYRKREIPILVETEKIARRNLTELVAANGRIQPVTQVKISPEVSGEIIELPVKEGQRVKKGDLLLRIKPDFYEANKRSAEANFKSALAGKELANANFKKADIEGRRNAKMLEASLISESIFLEYKTACDVALASFHSAEHQVDVARAALARAEEELAKTTIFSPIAGTVSKLVSQLGERVVGTAMMSGTEVMTVADLTEMEARVDIGEIDVVLIEPGQHVRLEADAYRERKFSGTVTEVANSSRQMGQAGAGGGGGGNQSQEPTRFEVRIRITEKEAFRPGMSVTAEIETRSRTNVLAVPVQSVTTRGATGSPAGGASTNAPGTNAPGAKAKAGGKTGEVSKPMEVLFVRDGERVKAVRVERGISDDNYTEITSGVQEGDEVISGGYKAISRDLEQGKKIKVGQPEGEKK